LYKSNIYKFLSFPNKSSFSQSTSCFICQHYYFHSHFCSVSWSHHRLLQCCYSSCLDISLCLCLQMFLVGLTGGIASGKSAVSSMLRELGCPIIDADVVARRGMRMSQTSSIYNVNTNSAESPVKLNPQINTEVGFGIHPYGSRH